MKIAFWDGEEITCQFCSSKVKIFTVSSGLWSGFSISDKCCEQGPAEYEPHKTENEQMTQIKTTLDAQEKQVNLATVDPMTQIKPAPYRLVIEAYKAPDARSASGITLAVGGKQEHVWKVLAVGEKVKRGVVGDLILCGQYNGIKIMIGGREIHIISQKEVFAILDV